MVIGHASSVALEQSVHTTVEQWGSHPGTPVRGAAGAAQTIPCPQDCINPACESVWCCDKNTVIIHRSIELVCQWTSCYQRRIQLYKRSQQQNKGWMKISIQQ